jgi:hypothetical protein
LQDEWRNFTGFLTALCGVCLNKEVAMKGRSFLILSNTWEVPVDPKSKNKKETDKIVKVIDSFIEELLDLLVAENKYVREAIMSVTGTSISHVAYREFTEGKNL